MKLKSFLPIVFLLAFAPLLIVAQDKGPKASEFSLRQAFEKDIPLDDQSSDREVLALWKEHLIVHLDRNTVSSDSPLFFKAYFVIGPNHLRITKSKVLKTELLNAQNEIVAIDYHKIKDGMAEGTILLPKKLKDKTYTLRAYTRWMQNYGASVYHTSTLENEGADHDKEALMGSREDLAVTFHPESGRLLDQVANRVLIKIKTPEGGPVDVESAVVDATGKLIVRPARFGPGLFSTIITPEYGKSYYLEANGQRFSLPKALAQGYALRSNNLDNSKLAVQVLATSNKEGSNIVLKGETGGITYFEKELTVSGTVQTLEIPKEKLPAGTMDLILYGSTGEEVVSRAIYIEPPHALTIAMREQEIEKDSGKFRATLKVTDAAGNPVRAKLALSATNYPYDTKVVGAGSFPDVFKPSQRAQRFEKDMQLLTGPLHGVKEESSHSIKEIKFPFQEGLDLFGYAYNLNNELLRNTKIVMYASTMEGAKIREFESDGQGRVRVQDLQFVGETQLVFRTQGDESAARLVKVVPIQEEHDPNTGNERFRAVKNLDKKDRITASPWIPEDDSDIIYLDEVEVAENASKKEEESTPSIYGVEPLRKAYQDPQRPRTIPELFLGIPGVQVSNLGNLNPELILPRAAGKGPILWVLDGLPLIQPTSLVDIMNMVPFADVERIEILDWAQAAMFGTRAAGGVIAIYTRMGSGMDYVQRKEGQMIFQGFSDAPTFEIFKEAMAKRPKKFAHRANTVYWHPALETDDNGEVNIVIDAPIPLHRLHVKASVVEQSGGLGSFQAIYE